MLLNETSDENSLVSPSLFWGKETAGIQHACSWLCDWLRHMHSKVQKGGHYAIIENYLYAVIENYLPCT